MFMTYADFETEAERTERETVAAVSDADWAEFFGASYVDPAEFEDREPLTMCCPTPGVAAASLCGCGGVPFI